MPFIGKENLAGQYALLDSITTDGSVSYSLLRDGVAFVPYSERNMIVSVNGVTQAPVAAYTISGSTITFAEALTSSDVIDYILILGDVFDIGRPSDDSVDTASIKDGAVTNAKIDTMAATKLTGTIANARLPDDITIGGNLVVSGNLQIDGTTTTINSTTLTVDDKNIVLASGAENAAAADGAGITVDGASATLTYNSSPDAWSFNKNVGIGTTSPDGKLNVFSASAGSVSADADADELVLENSGNVGLSLLTAGTGESGIYFGNPGTNGQKDFYLKFYHELHATTANRRAFTFNTASTERMRIDASGNVGIGTNNPAYNLDVSKGSAGTAARFTASTDNGRGLSFTSSDNGIYLGAIWTRDVASAAGVHAWSINSSEKMRINSAGELNINGTGANLLTGSGRGVLSIDGTSDSGMEFKAAGTTYGYLYTSSGEYRLAAYTAIPLTFFTSNAERMRVDSSGRLLVGKTSSSITTAGSEVTSGSILQSASSTSTNLATNNGAVINLCNISATDGNFSNIGGYNSNGLVVSQMNFINLSHSSRTGAITFSTHSGSALNEAMRIDSSGNVGFGLTAPGARLDIQTPSYATSTTDGMIKFNDSVNGQHTAIQSYHVGGQGADIHIGTNGYVNTSGSFSRWSASYAGAIASFYRQGVIAFNTNSSSGAVAERMRIDPSGNVGIGTSPTYRLDVSGAIRATNTSGSTIIANRTSNPGSLELQYDGTQTAQFSALSGGGVATYVGSTPTEAMRIDSSGNLLVATTDNASATGTVSGIRLLANGIFTAATSSDSMYISRRTTTGAIIQFRYNTTNVGTISTNGSTTSYNTSSDYRLKENVVSLDNATDRLRQIPVHRFNFIADPDTTVDGFVAHEVADVVPEAIVGTKDEVDDEGNPVYQGIDQSKLVPLLTAALQEALTKIESLETRLAALEAN